MHFNSALTAIALACSASTVVAVSHGQFAEYDGKVVRYQQLAPGVFTGIPVDEWNETSMYNLKISPYTVNILTVTAHTQSTKRWDIDAMVARSTSVSYDAIPALEDRNLRGQCQAAVNCVKTGGAYGWATVQTGYRGWLAALEYAANSQNSDLMKFLNQPFVANAAGVTLLGRIVNINSAKPESCSTSNSQADVLAAAIEAATKNKPEGTEVKVSMNGTDGSWTLEIVAAPEGVTPVPTC